jgi:hypothetical protein
LRSFVSFGRWSDDGFEGYASSWKALRSFVSFGRRSDDEFEGYTSSWKALRSFVSLGRRSDDEFEGYAAEVAPFVSLERPAARPCTLTALLSRQRGAVFASGGYASAHLYELECVAGTGSQRFA